MKQVLLSVFFLMALVSANAQVVVFSENFNGAALPAGWNVATLDVLGVGFVQGTSASISSQSFTFPNTGSNIVGTNDDKCNCNQSANRLITPSIDLSAQTGALYVELTQYYLAGTYQNNTETARLQASTNDGATWVNVSTIPANSVNTFENVYIDISSYAGESDVKFSVLYSDAGGWLFGYGLDAIRIIVPENVLSLALLSAQSAKFVDAIPGPIPTEKFLAGEQGRVYASIRSLGLVPITSFSVETNYGSGATITQNFTGLNITYQSFYDFELDEFNVPAGDQVVAIKIVNINGGADSDLTDNDIDFAVEGVVPVDGKRIFAEEGTGTWCGWCPRGKVFMEWMDENYGSYFVGVMVHNDDPITLNEYDSALGITGYPGCQIDRKNTWANSDPSEFYAAMLDRVTTPKYANIELTGSVNENNVATIEIKGIFNQSLSGGRMNIIIKEDGITNAGNQSNFYSGGTAPMGGWENLGTNVNATQNDVARALGGGFKGDEGSLPTVVNAGETHVYTYTLQLDSDWDVENLDVIGIVLKNSSGEVYNTISTPMTTVVAAQDIKALRHLRLFPNPANEFAFVEVSLDNTEEVSINVLNVVGQSVFAKDFGKINGTQQLNIDTKALPAGVYMVQINVGNQFVTRKLQVAK